MISRITFWSAQPLTVRSARFGPMPATSARRRSGACSITSNTASPTATASRPRRRRRPGPGLCLGMPEQSRNSIDLKYVTRLGDLRNWHLLTAVCSACRHQRQVRLWQLTICGWWMSSAGCAACGAGIAATTPCWSRSPARSEGRYRRSGALAPCAPLRVLKLSPGLLDVLQHHLRRGALVPALDAQRRLRSPVPTGCSRPPPGVAPGSAERCGRRFRRRSMPPLPYPRYRCAAGRATLGHGGASGPGAAASARVRGGAAARRPLQGRAPSAERGRDSRQGAPDAGARGQPAGQGRAMDRSAPARIPGNSHDGSLDDPAAAALLDRASRALAELARTVTALMARGDRSRPPDGSDRHGSTGRYGRLPRARHPRRRRVSIRC